MKKLSKNKLTIITVNFNAAKLVSELIDSIHASKDINFGIKIVVVENSQEDLSKLSGVTYLRNKGNLGFSSGNNLGIIEAEGDYVWFMNPDITVEPNTISHLINFMDKNPDVGVVTPKIILPNGKLDRNCRRKFPTPINSLKRFLGLNGYFIDTPENEKVEVDSVMGSNMLVRTEIGQKIGWWDEDYFMYGEDIEFCWRVKELGYKVMYIPDVIAHHHHGASSGLKKTSVKITIADNSVRRKAILGSTNAMRIFYKKHYAGNILVDPFIYLGIWFLERIRLLMRGL
ncbi:glycosyltransferase family 2 protein [Candidatus Amesbacteria bacterium]|nr:glycosyltransferase family 2 protein [Candidatus Amesbacteria bacterium]